MPEADMAQPATLEDGGASPSTRSIHRLEGKLRTLKRSIGWLEECLKRKNRELDFLHYVWCTGGCESGQHRWCQGEVTAQMMETAAANMARLRARFGSTRFKKLPKPIQAAWFESDHFKQFMDERRAQAPSGNDNG